ncbi:MAG: hypothetical protein F4X64_16110 [Chloroflexi bacterium]|nr:hypothetical protein [Chloroflexota bacterium]
MIQAKEAQSAGDSAMAQLPECEQRAIERAIEQREQRLEAEKARDLAELRDFGERCQRLEKMRSELTEKYPDQWVALTESYQQVVAGTITELVAKIEKGGERPEFAAAKRMHKQPRWAIPG